MRQSTKVLLGLMGGGINSASDTPIFAASRCTPGSEQNVNCNSTDSSGGSDGHDDATAALEGLCLEAVDRTGPGRRQGNPQAAVGAGGRMGLGTREDDTPIIRDTSRLVAHYFTPG